jgi:hypothetical protein
VPRIAYQEQYPIYRIKSANMESLNEEQTPFAAVTAQTSKLQRVRFPHDDTLLARAALFNR